MHESRTSPKIRLNNVATLNNQVERSKESRFFVGCVVESGSNRILSFFYNNAPEDTRSAGSKTDHDIKWRKNNPCSAADSYDS